MSMSSGTKSFIGEVAGWGVVAVLAALTMAHFDTVKTFAATALGLDAPRLAAASDAQGKGPAAAAAGDGTVELRAGHNGHFNAEVDVNGRSIDVMVDTGASVVALTYEDAERVGIFPKYSDFTHKVSTANGIARVAPVLLDSVEIGDIQVRDVRGVVAERGKLGRTLLGMSFLSRLEKFEMSAGTLVLKE